MIGFPITYFGPISWYSQLLRAESWKIDDREHYVKQTTRNHCLIATANGVQKLTVPVSMPHHPSPTTHHPVPITEVRLSDHGKWRTEHWNAICTAYGESPFFDYYVDDLRPFFERRDWEFLFDYDMAIIEKTLELVGIAPKGQGVQEFRSPGVQEFRSSGVQTNVNSQPSTVNSQLSTLNCQLSTVNSKKYWQVYQQRHGFLPDLSILDLLCCMGPEAVLYL